MSEINLFKISESKVEELFAKTALIEKELQALVEKHMEEFFGVRFIKTEHVTSNGRIDSLGIDENNSPVIFEYKRKQDENVINQGLFYLNWLVDHRGDFKDLVLQKFGKETANGISWENPTVFCIANDFNKYDEYAVKEMKRNIYLIRYKKFGEELLLFETIYAPKEIIKTKNVQEKIKNKELEEIYEEIRKYILDKGDDVTENPLKYYVAFKKIRNIACVEVHSKNILMYLKLDPTKFVAEDGFSKNMIGTGHYGTGDFEIRIKNSEDFEKAKPFIDKAYEEN
ncbi:MAG: endonuclease NucS domain-containing protein [Fusobacteriaceae bacterium]